MNKLGVIGITVVSGIFVAGGISTYNISPIPSILIISVGSWGLGVATTLFIMGLLDREEYAKVKV